MEDNVIKMANDMIEEARFLTLAEEKEKAIQEYDKAAEVLKDLADSKDVLEVKARCYKGKASLLKDSGRVEESKQFFKKAVNALIGIKFENKAKQNSVNLDLALSLAELGNIDKAAVYADKVLNGMNSKGYAEGVVIESVAQVYMYRMDKYYKKAKKALMQARSCFETNLSKETVTRLLDIQRILAVIERDFEKNDAQTVLELDKAWEYVEKVGIESLSQDMIVILLVGATNICHDKACGETWDLRALEHFGKYIEQGNFKAYGMSLYFRTNISWLITKSTLNEFLTVERALKYLDLMNSMTQNPLDIAKAQWLAGCALINLGTLKDTRRAIRLIKTAIKILKTTKEEINLLLVAIGEGYIADYHLACGEYDLAERWYQAALKGVEAGKVCCHDAFAQNIAVGLSRARDWRENHGR
ncbi:MAG: hypothetical protein LBT59_19080 [Clostridiales bacterium]|nr:hypothetical protein [Clostridiales bacterium]